MLSMKHKKHIRMGDKLLTYCFLKWKYLQYVINCLKGLKQPIKVFFILFLTNGSFLYIDDEV